MQRMRREKPTVTNNNNGRNEAKRVFVNDELTQLNRYLLWKTKNKAKELQWKFVWVKDGRIMAKKEETTRIFYIRNEPDIENLN